MQERMWVKKSWVSSETAGDVWEGEWNAIHRLADGHSLNVNRSCVWWKAGGSEFVSLTVCLQLEVCEWNQAQALKKLFVAKQKQASLYVCAWEKNITRIFDLHAQKR